MRQLLLEHSITDLPWSPNGVSAKVAQKLLDTRNNYAPRSGHLILCAAQAISVHIAELHNIK